MRINRIGATNFKGFKHLEVDLDGKSTVFFGVNGTGKSTALSIINYVFWNWVNRLNGAQGIAYRSFQPEMVHAGARDMQLAVEVEMDGSVYELWRVYTKAKMGKAAISSLDKKEYDGFVEQFMQRYIEVEDNMPIFVNYGTNRSVLDIPLRIRNKHQFSKVAALERCIENELDFRTFFEWFRNQEDLENEQKNETKNLEYEDPALRCVRTVIKKMMDNVTSPKVKRNPLRMVVKKGGAEFRVDQLSDGEKCTLAMLGDLARRIALANPYRKNPLEGDGVVLIDEIELHMHPLWQRRVLNVLKEVFPNIQFIISTHSPQVLSEVDDSYNIYKLSNGEEDGSIATQIRRLDVFDTCHILEEYMETASTNPVYQALLDDVYLLIADQQFDEAEKKIHEIVQMTGDSNTEDLIQLEGALKRGRIQHAKNHKG